MCAGTEREAYSDDIAVFVVLTALRGAPFRLPDDAGPLLQPVGIAIPPGRGRRRAPQGNADTMTQEQLRARERDRKDISILTADSARARIIVVDAQGRWYCHLLASARLCLLAPNRAHMRAKGLAADGLLWIRPEATIGITARRDGPHRAVKAVWDAIADAPIGDSWRVAITRLAGAHRGLTFVDASSTPYRVILEHPLIIAAKRPGLCRSVIERAATPAALGRWIPIAKAIPHVIRKGCAFWIILTERGILIASSDSGHTHFRIMGGVRELWARGIDAISKDVIYRAPGKFLPGEDLEHG